MVCRKRPETGTERFFFDPLYVCGRVIRNLEAFKLKLIHFNRKIHIGSESDRFWNFHNILSQNWYGKYFEMPGKACER